MIVCVPLELSVRSSAYLTGTGMCVIYVSYLVYYVSGVHSIQNTAGRPISAHADEVCRTRINGEGHA